MSGLPSWPRLGPSLRLARRDVRRSPGRSLLIVAMVALPVSGAAAIDVVLRTADVRGAERIELELGRTADARVVAQTAGNLIVQRPDEASGVPPAVVTGAGETATETEQLPPTDPLPLLPPGSRSIPDARAEVQVRTAKGLTRAAFRELDYADPLADGIYAQVDGRAPRTTGEVAVSVALLDVLGLQVGDDLEVVRPRTALRIVGTVRPNSDRFGTDLAVALPGALLPAVAQDTRAGAGYVEQLGLLVDTPAPVTWSQVLALNQRGVAVFSRAVLTDPPPRAEVPLYATPGYEEGSRFGLAELVAAVLVVGLAIAEVSLLAGAAFAVGIRRQSRALGLYAATGAHRRQVRAVVLAQGVVLGGLGGLVGVGLGVLAGIGGVHVLSSRFDRFLLAPDLRPLELVGLTLVGVLTGLLASVLPARTAARQDVVVALTGRRGVVRTRRRYPVVGLVTAALGAALALGGGAYALTLPSDGAATSRQSLVAGMILVGAVLTQLGLIVATPALIGGAARLGRFLPLAPRLALRDAARHRGRSAPAVAAVLGAVAGSVALTLFVASKSDSDERAYTPVMALGQARLAANDTFTGIRRDTGPLVAAVRRIAPPADVFDVRGFENGAGCTSACRYVAVVAPPETRCPAEVLGADGSEVTQEQYDLASRDPRCQSSSFNASFNGGPVVGTYEDFVRLTGLESAPARRSLESGGMLVFEEGKAVDGRGFVEVTTVDSTTRPRLVEVPAVVVTRGPGDVLPSSWLSPEAAQAVGVPVVVGSTVLQYAVPPTDDQEEAVSAALADLGERNLFRVERGYRDAYGAGLLALLVASALVTLGASGVATGLAQADARADHATLAAVGADPRVRRRLTAFQAAVVAGLGALLGTVSGFVPTVAFLYADAELRFVAPWQNLLVIAVVVPAVAAVAAGLLTRSRLPLARRLG